MDERKDKLSDCERSFFTIDDGTIGCKCPRRVSPKPFKKSTFKKAFTIISDMEGDLADNCATFLKKFFKASSMNICQTQPLSMMNVEKMTVEFKEGFKGMKAKRTSRVIPVPLAMREQTKKDLDSSVKMGILEDNHDLWLAPMIVVPKKDNTPRRVIDFSLLNRFCKRSAEATLDTNRMATAVPVPEEGKEIFFSCLDAWNGYHSIPLDDSAKNFLGFLTEYGTYR